MLRPLEVFSEYEANDEELATLLQSEPILLEAALMPVWAYEHIVRPALVQAVEMVESDGSASTQASTLFDEMFSRLDTVLEMHFGHLLRKAVLAVRRIRVADTPKNPHAPDAGSSEEKVSQALSALRALSYQG